MREGEGVELVAAGGGVVGRGGLRGGECLGKGARGRSGRRMGGGRHGCGWSGGGRGRFGRRWIVCRGGGDAVDELEEGLVSEGFLPEGGVDEEVFVDVDAEVACGSGGRGRKVEVVEELG